MKLALELLIEENQRLTYEINKGDSTGIYSRKQIQVIAAIKEIKNLLK